MSSQPVAEVGQCERRARSSLGPRRIPDGTCFRLSQGAVELETTSGMCRSEKRLRVFESRCMCWVVMETRMARLVKAHEGHPELIARSLR